MRQTIIFIGIFVGLLFWNFWKYYDQLGAFQKQEIVSVVVQGTTCGKRSSISVKDGGSNKYVRLKRKQCVQLTKGETIEVIRSGTGKLYWNEEPGKRVFWMIPGYLLIAGYIFLWHHRKRKKKMKRRKGKFSPWLS